ncbi:MAG: glycosyltransferase family 39 protein [Candidatus Giovannonibacteria bacterium]|nr:glycosyltransferase family 39 protein [Candidatus Giovannonibacteria bacterium]
MFSKQNLILCALFLILLFFGVWQLPKSPATWFDEGINLSIAKSLITHGVYSLEIGPGEFVEMRQFLITSNYPVILPVALSLKFFGFNLTAARFPMVLFLIAFVLAAYFLVKKLYSKEAAIISIALIVTFTPFYGNGKDVLGEIPGLFYFLCALLLLAPEFNFKKLFFAGLFVGLSAATKPFFLIVPSAILVGELFNPLAPSWRDKLKRIAALAAGGILPIIFWLYTILPAFSLAGVKSAVFYYSNSYASANFGQLIFQNFMRFFTESTPIHFLVLFLVSAAFIFWKKKKGENIKEVEIIFAVFTLLALAFYLKTPGWYRYFFSAHMILFLISPVALISLFNKKTAVIAVAFLFLFQFTYTISQRNSSLYNSDEAIVFSKYVIEITTPEDKILIINGPSAAFLIDGRQIYQHLQINPVLFFGKTDIENYNYVAVQGLPIDRFADALKSHYEIQKQIGHYSLYRKINQ